MPEKSNHFLPQCIMQMKFVPYAVSVTSREDKNHWYTIMTWKHLWFSSAHYRSVMYSIINEDNTSPPQTYVFSTFRCLLVVLASKSQITMKATLWSLQATLTTPSRRKQHPAWNPNLPDSALRWKQDWMLGREPEWMLSSSCRPANP